MSAGAGTGTILQAAGKIGLWGAPTYRVNGGARPEVMLVTSRETRRWIIPKGWPKKGKSPHHSAAREAFEEGWWARLLGAPLVRSHMKSD